MALPDTDGADVISQALRNVKLSKGMAAHLKLSVGLFLSQGLN